MAPEKTVAKTKRMSLVALTGAILALLWAVVDEVSGYPLNPAIVSGVTSLAMLVAGFVDFRHEDDSVLYDGGVKNDG